MFRGAATCLDTWSASTDYQPTADLSDGATATASSFQLRPFTNLRPARAIDDDRRTRWASRWNDGQ